MSSVPQSNTLNYSPPGAYRPPIWQRINLRMIVFVMVAMSLVAYPVYVYLDSMLSGGIKTVADGYKAVDLKAMSMFEFDPQSSTIDDVPRKWRELDGQKVILYGEQYQPFSAANRIGVDGFDLCYSIAKCCVGGPPKVQHFVHSKLLPGHTADYFYGNLVKATGILHVKVTQDPGTNYVNGIYYMDVQSVEPVE
jgi:hypothetical protein